MYAFNPATYWFQWFLDQMDDSDDSDEESTPSSKLSLRMTLEAQRAGLQSYRDMLSALDDRKVKALHDATFEAIKQAWTTGSTHHKPTKNAQLKMLNSYIGRLDEEIRRLEKRGAKSPRGSSRAKKPKKPKA